MSDGQMLTQGRLLELMHYDPETGVMRRKVGRYAASVGAPAGRLNGGYLRVSIDNSSYYVHRLAWLYMTGSWPSGQIDHRSFDRTDNRFANLRDASAKQNNENKRALRTNTSGAKGVSRNRGKWRARIGHLNAYIDLGTFCDKADACTAYAAGAARLHTHNPAATAA